MVRQVWKIGGSVQKDALYKGRKSSIEIFCNGVIQRTRVKVQVCFTILVRIIFILFLSLFFGMTAENLVSTIYLYQYYYHSFLIILLLHSLQFNANIRNNPYYTGKKPKPVWQQQNSAVRERANQGLLGLISKDNMLYALSFRASDAR